ncbi:hypothetical protein NPIL_685061 [Nephila pilipes]|uniref:Uncharacterized protein n=1 Tax=Nephila pilipes TaxID=299642 RepID=A0A8X6PEF2_NEPPI|nr:hypothetical protein NPIL_685061 [Nephila pilipes]
MGTDCDKSEVVHLDVWKSGVLLKILAICSPPCNSSDFSYVNHCKHTIFVADFKAHSPIGVYSDTNEAGGRVQDFLISSTFELVYNKGDPHTDLHYNDRRFTPDLLMVTADLYKFTKRTVLKDPGSGHRQMAAPTFISYNNEIIYSELISQQMAARYKEICFQIREWKIYKRTFEFRDVLF